MNAGTPAQRAVFEAVLAAALRAVEPGTAVRSVMRVDGNSLVVGRRRLSLHPFRRVLVVGAGKASAPMAAAVEDLLAPTGLAIAGSVTVRYEHAAATRHVQVREASHPVPDEAGVAATREIAALLAGADAADLVLCVISGGGSALLTLPVDGISLEDLQRTTGALLRSGATIDAINTVRKRLDRVKGGGLARFAAHAGALVTLVLSDVVGNPLDAIASGPTVPDPTTWADAGAIMGRYGLWEAVPAPVADRLRAGLTGAHLETPKTGDALFDSSRSHVEVVGSNLVACRAAAAEAQRHGSRSLVLTTYVEGEAREAARVLAGFLREVDGSGHPLPRPCCLVAGGETTVTVKGSGRGGRNQELALAAAFPLDGIPDILFASIGTDGSDGPTNAAGAVVDGSTLRRSREAGLDAARHLRENDSYAFFEPLGDLVQTGPTHTNVNDLYVLFAF